MSTGSVLFKSKLFLGISLSFLVGSTIFFSTPSIAAAAQLKEAFLRLDRMSDATTTGGTVCVKMFTAGDTDAKLKVTFPAGFTVNGTAGNWQVTTDDLPENGNAMPGIGTATLVASSTVTWPITNIANDTTLYCFNFIGTTTLTTGTSGNDKTGTIQITDSGDTEIDAAGYAVSVIADDQVTVTATVPATFSLALGTNAQALSTLSTGSVTSGSGISCTVITNAGNGWLGWVKSQNQALTSASSGGSIPTTGTVNDSPNTLSAGTAGYVLDADETLDFAGGGNVTIDLEYNGGDTSSGGTLSATYTEFATADGPSGGDIVTLIPRVAISGLTPAGTDYRDVLTIVASGNF